MVEAIKKPTHMPTEEEVYKKQLAESGVDLPELNTEGGDKPEPKEEPAKEEPEPKAPAKDKPEAKADDDGEGEDDKSKPPIEQKKRSIYDEYKDKKVELKSVTVRAEQAEKERDELRDKLNAIETAKTPEDKKDALDEFDEFAKEIDADPESLKKMRDLFLKGIKPDEALQKDLLEFKKWKSEQQNFSAVQQFEKEFTQTLPVLKTYFPNANDSEMTAIKTELDKISHSTGWNDKDLEYIAFKHKDTLSALVSPKKRGMESTTRQDVDTSTSDFNPNADYSKMTPAEKDTWEKQYKEIMKNSKELVSSPDGRKLML